MIGRLTLFESRSALAKHWELNSEGQPVKTSAAQMTRGTYRTCEFSNAPELAALLDGVTTNQAVCASLAHDGSAEGEIITKALISSNPGKKVRGKRDFGLQTAPGFLFIDHDSATSEGGLDCATLWRHLTEFVPALKSAGVAWRPSGSSHIFKDAQDLTKLRGQHVFALTSDASDAPRVVKVIAARFWLAGLGRIEVSSSGALLQRCPVDLAPSDSARLIFAAGAECVSPLEQRRGPTVILSDGGFLDSRRDVCDLTAEEQGRLEGLIEQAKTAAMPAALQKRAEHRCREVARRVPEMMKQGVGAADAQARVEAAVDAVYGGLLLGDAELTIVHADGRHQVITVAQALADRDRYSETDILEPSNPGHRGGSPDCRLYLQSSSPIAYSLDSGQVYRLRSAKQQLTVSRGARGELVSELTCLVAQMDNVFSTDTGPVVIERGRRFPLTVDRLMNLVSNAVVLSSAGAKSHAPTDMTRETAVLVLAALNT